MAGLVSIYWLMSYLSKDSFILEISFDLIWSLCAEEKKNDGEEGNDDDPETIKANADRTIGELINGSNNPEQQTQKV